ncbi:MAG: hypothetical protein M1379_04760 [Firmicutes bacterium]|nr:hypothetical protein [Bacillota bacterium]
MKYGLRFYIGTISVFIPLQRRTLPNFAEQIHCCLYRGWGKSGLPWDGPIDLSLGKKQNHKEAGKMVKRVCLSLVFMLLIASLSMPVLAVGNGQVPPGFGKKLEKINSLVGDDIERTVTRADRIMEGRKDGTAFRNAEEQLVRLAYGLLSRTGYIVAAIQREAERLGIPLEVTYIPVQIGNMIVLVDPMRVCGH